MLAGTMAVFIRNVINVLTSVVNVLSTVPCTWGRSHGLKLFSVFQFSDFFLLIAFLLHRHGHCLRLVKASQAR